MEGRQVKKPELQADHAHCRIYSHDWDAVDDIVFTREGYWETLLCVRCGTQRRALIERGTGYVKSRGYKYPKGYQIKGGITRQQLGQVRLTLAKQGGFRA